jgi:hypothetical protein
MKRRVFLTYGAATLVASALCIGFTACGTTTTKAEEQTDEISATSAQQTDEVTNSLDESTNEMIAKAFDELSFTNVKIDFNVDTTTNYHTKTVTANSTESVIIADNLMYVDSVSEVHYKTYQVNATVQTYTQADGDTIYYYVKNVKDDTWYRSQIDNVSSSELEAYMPVYEKIKNKISYDEAKDGYTFTKTVHNVELEYVMKFEDKKLSSITATGVKEAGRITGTVDAEITFTYGGQTLTLPQDYVDKDLEVADVLDENSQELLETALDKVQSAASDTATDNASDTTSDTTHPTTQSFLTKLITKIKSYLNIQ